MKTEERFEKFAKENGIAFHYFFNNKCWILTLSDICDPFLCNHEDFYKKMRPEGTLPKYSAGISDWYQLQTSGNSKKDAAKKMLIKLNDHTFARGFCSYPSEKTHYVKFSII